MKDYEKRFIAEYLELQDKVNKLNKLLENWGDEKLGFELKCPAKLLFTQLETMEDYLGVLEARAEYEDIDLNEFKS